MASPTARGSYFGVAALSLAIGGGLGNFAGGFIYDYGVKSGQPALPWLIFLAVGAVAVAGLWRIRAKVSTATAAMNGFLPETPIVRPVVVSSAASVARFDSR
jgi:MFS family permease